MRFDLLVPRPTLRPPFFGIKWAYNGFRPPFLSQNRSKRPLKQSNCGIYSDWTPHYMAVFGHIKLICDVVWNTQKLLYGRKRPYRRKIKKSIELTWKKLTLFAPSRPYRNLNIFGNIAPKTKMKVSTSTKSLLSPNANIQTILTEPRPQLYMYLKWSFSTENKKGIYYSWQDTKASSAYLARMCTLRVS